MNNQSVNPAETPGYSIYSSEKKADAHWHKSYDSGVPFNVDIEDTPLYSLLDQAAEKSPAATALHFKNYKLNYAQLQRQAEIMAANLRAHGVGKGDSVAIMLPNLPQTIIAFWAVLKAGGIVVFTNPLYMEKEILHQMNDANVKCVITIDLCWSKFDALRMRLGVKKYFVTSVTDTLSFTLKTLYNFKNRNKKTVVNFDKSTVLPFMDLLKGDERLSTEIENPADTVAALQYSGGTTGIPKGVMLSHKNFMANVQQTAIFLDSLVHKPHRFLAVLPFFHVYGLCTCLLLPAAIRASIYPMPRFVPNELLTMIEKYKISIFPGAPSVYIATLQQKNISKFNLSSLECCISGSAPMPVEYIKMFSEKTNGAKMIEGYGLTEASPITHLNPFGGSNRNGSIGVPLPGTEAQIVDMELGSLPIPPGGIGELIIKGPQVMKGYWNRADETANALRNNWLYTGDIATMDEDGYFYIVDRKKDMVIVGGYNVYPREIDEVLYTHPKIKEAVAVGIAHKSRGEIIKVYVVLKDGETLTKTELLAFCREKLANYKVPKQIEFRDELPKSLVGKILRRTLRTEEDEKRKSNPNAPEEETFGDDIKQDEDQIKA